MIARPGRRRRRPVRARRRRQAAVLRPQRRRARRRRRRSTSSPARGRRAHAARRPHARVPVFQLLAERYLDPQYAPDAVAERCGIPADTIRRIAAELAHAAFDSRRSRCRSPGPTAPGRQHDDDDRPAGRRCMRCAASRAHSNGFQTCRALHLLQMLLGAIDAPGRLPLQAAVSRSRSPPAATARQGRATPTTPLTARRSASRTARRTCWSTPTARRVRIDKAFSWDAPLAAHGMMHMVIGNAGAAIPTRSTCCSCTWPTWPGTRR